MIKDDYYKKLFDKLNKLLNPLFEGNIIIIYQDGKYKLIKSNIKTHQPQSKDLLIRWVEL